MAQKRARRRFTREYKAQAVQRVSESGRPLADIAVELDVSCAIRRWQASEWDAVGGCALDEADQAARGSAIVRKRLGRQCPEFRVWGRAVAPCSGHGSCEALAEEDGELGLGHAPLTGRHGPLFLRPVQDQEEELQRRLVGREMTPGPNRAPEL